MSRSEWGGGSQAPKHAPRAKRTPFALLVLGLIVGGMCTLLALNTASAANEVRRHDIAARDEAVAAQLVQVQNDAHDSAAPANLARAAGDLGMVPAGNPGFLEVRPDGSVHVLGSAAPATAAPIYVASPKPTKTKAAKPTTTTTRAVPSKSAARSTMKSAARSTTKSAATSKSATATKSPGKSATPTKNVKPTRTKTRHPAPSPSPTPTPNSTLPGGDR